MKKPVKIALWTLLTPIALLILLTALFYFPPFQNWMVGRVAAIASEKTGMEISVERVNLAFPLDLAVDGVRVLKQNDSLPQLKDTIADIKHTVVDVQLLPLLSQRVEVDELDIRSIQFNTTDFISSARVKGHARELLVRSHGIDLKQSDVMLDRVMLDGANIDVQLSDTAQEDTTQSENLWKIRLAQLQIKKSAVTLHMPGDTLEIGAYLGDARVKDGLFDLRQGIYQTGRVDIGGSRVTYDNNFEPIQKGLDYNHISLSGVSLALDSLKYEDPNLLVKIRSAALKEKSGLQLTHLSGTVKMDSTTLFVENMLAAMPESKINLDMSMDLNAFDEVNPGSLKVDAKAELGKNDLMLFMQDMPAKFKTGWPHRPLIVTAKADGNLQRLNVSQLSAELPTAFKATATGYIANMLDTKNLLANLDVDIKTYNLNFATSSFLDADLQKMVRVPSGIGMRGHVSASGSTYTADVKASYGGGIVSLNGRCNVATMAYKADISARSLPLQKFLPTMGLSPFTGKIKVDGIGTDIYSRKTRLDAEAEIGSFRYGDFDLSGTTASVKVNDGKAYSNIHCINELLKGDIGLDALLDKKDVRATLTCSLDKADLYGMKLTESPLTTSLCAHMDVSSDMDEYYKLQGYVSDMLIRDTASVFRTEELSIDATTRRDSTWAKVYSGDLALDFTASGGYKRLMYVADNLIAELNRQIARKYISQDSIKQVFPTGHLTMHVGQDNFAYAYAARMGYAFRELNADISTSPADGLNGYAQIDSLYAFDMQLDKVRLDLSTEDNVFKYKAQVKNEKDNPQYCFNALLDGSLFETGSNCNLALYDANDKLGLKLGLKAMLEPNGIRIKLADSNVVLGYRNFTANDDNYVFMADNNRVSANMILKADDGTGLQVYSDDENEDALQDITLGISHLDLASIVGIVPYMPDVKGVIDGDFHVIQTEKELSVSSSVDVSKFFYEGTDMGDLSTEFVYMPQEDGGHYVDGILSHNGNEIGTIKGTYTPGETDGTLNADVDLARFPLSLANGFVPDQIVGLKGYGDGRLKMNGPLSRLDVEGEVDLDSAYLVSIPYGLEMRFDNRPVQIKGSKLLLDNFNMYANNDQPLVINGYIDFTDVSNMKATMRMKARKFLLVDAKENRKSEAFGKAYVNFDGYMNGPLSALQIRGNLDVLGSTDVTYIMRDTPLTTDNKLEELVKFTDFNQQEEASIVRPPIEGLYMDLNISIADGARVFCALNTTKTNYLDVMGGGDLRMIYSADDLRLTGRYTLKSGEMKYSLPVIPLKTFTITEGSYVEFTGEVMNPTLNITATETTKANVTTDGSARSVTFNCGVVITQTLNNMGLEFIISAPEDVTLNSELQAMSKEERGKLAVTMLTTGMYLNESNLSSFSMNDALNSFLQSEINTISGNALRTLDLSIGLDNTKDAAGALHTDYTFKFAKRFWNNRIRVVIGGKVSSTQASAENLFDNVAFEYRLDQSANANLRLFYDRATYDYLEGYVGQYGVGIAWKRKLQSLRELVDFRKWFRKDTQSVIPSITNDSVNAKKGETK